MVGDLHRQGLVEDEPACAGEKAGLNKALLGSAMGQILAYTAYKAARRNKLVLLVDPRYTSQECAECGHVAAENRLTQAAFHCVACGHEANADHNAARVIKARGIRMIREGRVGSKPKKTARVRGNKQKVGPVRPEPGATPTLVENMLDAVGGHAANGAVFDEAGNRHYSANGA
jgi:transposase